MPSAFSRATAGATIAQSSSPSVPSSPAWGLSPATASRGRGMRNRPARSRATMRPVSITSSVDRCAEDFAQRQMDRHRHDRQLGRPQHHDRPLPLAGRLLRQRRQKFGLPRLGETPAIEDILRHRTGNHGGGGAGENVGDRAAQRRDGGGRARPIGTTRLGAHRNIEVDHRQSGRKRRGSRRRRHRGDRDFKVEPLGAPADKIRIGDQIKSREIEFGPSTPDRHGKIGADPGGFTERQCQRLHVSLLSAYLLSSVILYSINAPRRKLSR